MCFTVSISEAFKGRPGIEKEKIREERELSVLYKGEKGQTNRNPKDQQKQTTWNQRLTSTGMHAFRSASSRQPNCVAFGYSSTRNANATMLILINIVTQIHLFVYFFIINS